MVGGSIADSVTSAGADVAGSAASAGAGAAYSGIAYTIKRIIVIIINVLYYLITWIMSLLRTPSFGNIMVCNYHYSYTNNICNW